MMGIKKDSNLLLYGRFGIGSLVIGGAVTWFSVAAVREFPQEPNAWLALTMSLTMTACGIGTILYGWGLDRWGKRPDTGNSVSEGPGS